MRATALFACLATASVPAQADIVYRPSLETQCFEASLIVDVAVTPRGVVVQAVLHGPETWQGQLLSVPNLNSVERSIGWLKDPDQAIPIAPTRALLFLNADATLYASGDQGSPSIYWADANNQVYGYHQPMNPGNLRLTAGGPDYPEIPDTWPGLSTRVATALSERAVWEQALAQAPAEQARRLAPYTAHHSSPPNYRMHTVPQRILRPKLAALGAVAAEPLAQVLQTAPQGADLNLPVLALYDIGPAAKAALPALQELKLHPGATHEGYIDTAIATISAQ